MNAVRNKRAITCGKDADDFFSQVFMAWLKDTREALTVDKAKRFREVFDKGVSDKDFVLRGLRLGVNTALAISQGMQRPPLQRLDLYENLVRDAGAEALATLIHDTVDLIHLNLGGNDIGPAGALHLAPVIHSHKRLQVLLLGSDDGDMHANRIDSASGKVLAEAVKASKSLKILDLNRNPLGLTDQESFREVACALEKQSPLQVLRLGDTGMSTESAVEIVSKLAKNGFMQELDFQGNDLNHQAAEAFAKVFQERSSRGQYTPLQRLFLQNNPRLGERGTSPLFNSLSFSKSAVMVLNVSNTGVTDDAVLCLANALKSATTLQTLNLSRNHITELGCMALAQQLEVAQSVTFLSLSHNKVRCEGAVALASMIECNTCVTTLELDEGRVGDQGCIALGVALTSNTALKHLRLSCNHISDEAGRAFSSLVEKNRTIQGMSVKGNQVDHATMTKLKRILKRNKGLKDNEIPNKLHKEVVRLHYQQCKLQEAHNELLHHQRARMKLQEEMDRHDAGLMQEREENDKKSHELLEKMRREEQDIDDIDHKMRTKERDYTKFEADLKLDVERLNERLDEETRRREEVEKKLAEKKSVLDSCMRERDVEKTQIEEEITKVRLDTEKYQQQAVEMSEKLQNLHGHLAKLEQMDADATSKEQMSKGAADAAKEAKRDRARKKKDEEQAANAILFDSSSSTHGTMVTAEQLEQKIKEKVGGMIVEVKSMDGGCSDKFEAFIVSEAFVGVKLLQRQRLVNEAIAEEMKEIHAFTYKKCMTPEQYEDWKAKQ